MPQSRRVLQDLSNTPVAISLSEPWELGEALGWHLLLGQIQHAEAWAAHAPDLDVQGTKLLIRLDRPFTFKNQGAEWLVGTPRHRPGPGDDPYAIFDRSFNFVRVPAKQALSEKPLDTTWWRGGLTLIGQIRHRAPGG